jgi:hypothetical protein
MGLQIFVSHAGRSALGLSTEAGLLTLPFSPISMSLQGFGRLSEHLHHALGRWLLRLPLFRLRNLSFHLGCNQGLNPFLVAVMVHSVVQVIRHLVHNLGHHHGQLLFASLGQIL